MSTVDLRDESGVKDRAAFTRALDELQAAMIVVPSEVLYQPKFTYIWTLAVGRFPDALRRRVESRHRAARDRPRLSRRRRHDDSRRAGARDRPVRAGKPDAATVRWSRKATRRRPRQVCIASPQRLHGGPPDPGPTNRGMRRSGRSLVPKREHRIDAAGAMGRNEPGERRHDRQQQYRRDGDRRVAALDPIQLR